MYSSISPPNWSLMALNFHPSKTNVLKKSKMIDAQKKTGKSLTQTRGTTLAGLGRGRLTARRIALWLRFRHHAGHTLVVDARILVPRPFRTALVFTALELTLWNGKLVENDLTSLQTIWRVLLAVGLSSFLVF
jgi:hypothetical protein